MGLTIDLCHECSRLGLAKRVGNLLLGKLALLHSDPPFLEPNSTIGSGPVFGCWSILTTLKRKSVRGKKFLIFMSFRAKKSVDVDLHFRKRLGAGLFGGEGFVLQKLTSPGMAFVNFDGEIVEKTLAAGEVLRVDTGHVAMFQPSVDFDVEIIKGFKNILLGGEGLFMATLRGPGRVFLQSMPLDKLARKMAQFMPKVGGDGRSGGMNINLGQLMGGE